MAAAAPVSQPSQPPQRSQKLSHLERMPKDHWAKIAAFVGEKFALCHRVNHNIHQTLSALGTGLWYEHCLVHSGSPPKGQDWQVHFMRSGLSLQMGMTAKPPSIRESGAIRACVLEGHELAIAKRKRHDDSRVVSEVTWSNLVTGSTKTDIFKEGIYSLSFQRGVFAAVGEDTWNDKQRLHIWRPGKGSQSVRSDLKGPWVPKDPIYCRIGHGNVLLSGCGPGEGVGLSLIDLETGKTILPFTRSSHDTDSICGAYSNRTLFMDPHTVLTAHIYISGEEAFTTQKLHVWDLRVGFHRDPAQSYLLTQPFCRDFTLNWRGEICTATTDKQNSTGSSLLSLWDTRTSRCFKSVRPKGDMAIGTLASMGGVIFSGSNNGVVRCWDSQLKLMGKWVMPKAAQTVVSQIALSPSMCVFLTQEIPSGARASGMSTNLNLPTTLWQAISLPFEPAHANAAAAPAAPSPMAAAGAGAAAAASR